MAKIPIRRLLSTKRLATATMCFPLPNSSTEKELSYNNINDANGALDVIKEFGYDVPCAVGVKHANPCGVGLGSTILEAYQKAYEADPVSIFGGIVALNREVDEATATELAKIFLEIIIAPSFSKEAPEILTKKKNIRLLELEGLAKPNTPDMMDMKKVAGGLLVPGNRYPAVYS